MIDQDSIPLSQLQEQVTTHLNALIRDWISCSWMYPDTGPHPIAAASRALVSAVGGEGPLNVEFIHGDYTAPVERKLQAWETAAAKAIAQWDPQRVSALIALFPKCIPAKYQKATLEMKHAREGWYCSFAETAPPELII